MPDGLPARADLHVTPELPMRRAGAADAGAVRLLVHAAYAHYEPILGRTPMPMLTDYDAALREHEVWLLETPDGALAAVLELIERPGQLWIDNVAVEPGWQGRGLGRRLLAFADDEARRRGLPELGLLTNERYTTNIAMYERYGFRETRREPHLGSDLVHFRKTTPG